MTYHYLYDYSKLSQISNIRLNFDPQPNEQIKDRMTQKTSKQEIEIRKDLETEIHWKFGIHENRLKR